MCALQSGSPVSAALSPPETPGAALAAAAGAAADRAEIPLPRSSFIGRDAELAALALLLRPPGARVVTITGPGGVGKTRLALQAARHLRPRFAGGVRFISLAACITPAQVLPAIAQGLGSLTPLPGPPVEEPTAAGAEGGDEPAALLLVLDNFEHVLPAAAALDHVLALRPALTLLVTSRERLRLVGEREFPLAPLPVPSRLAPAPAAGEGESAAVRLFVERARATVPDFALVAGNVVVVEEICRRLDGLPLAIELAAARANALSPEAMLTRLEPRLPLLIGGARDAPSRLRTMRDAIGWSYDLLDDAERRVFREVAVFAGGGTLDAIEAVVSLPAATAAVDVVCSLVDKSLLQRDPVTDRFTMLETVREFAAERLAASGEEATIRQRHAEWYLAIAERAEAAAFSGEWAAALTAVAHDYDNLLAALDWSTGQAPAAAATGLRLACALWLFWVYRGYVSEGRWWFERAVAAAGQAPASPSASQAAADATVAGVPPALTAKALLGLGGLAQMTGDPDAARRFGHACLALYETLGDQLGLARARHLLGSLAHQAGEAAPAAALLTAAVAGYTAAAGQEVWLALASAELGVIEHGRGDEPAAARLLAQASAIRDRLGAAWPELFPLPSLDQLSSVGAAAASPPDDGTPASLAMLSPREGEVLRLVAAGLSNAAIAARLNISVRTASTHVSNILAKLGLASRAEVIAFVFRQVPG